MSMERVLWKSTLAINKLVGLYIQETSSYL
jgi:hypothetical protein